MGQDKPRAQAGALHYDSGRWRTGRRTEPMKPGLERKIHWLDDARHSLWMAAVTLLLCSCLAPAPVLAATPAKPLTGLVSIADGEPFTLIRADKLFTAGRGVTVLPGDMLETGAGAFVVIEMSNGSLIGMGPDTWLYLLPRSDQPTLVVLKGWIKFDAGATTAPGPMWVIGTRLGIQAQKAAVILFADDRADTLFEEQGVSTLVLRDDAAKRTERETQPGQFFVRETHQAVVLQPRPSAEFLKAMPVAFRDALPPHASGRLKTTPEPKAVRDVSYADVQTWLSMPRDWRTGFIGRFGGRLRDAAFRSALDAHMAQHPEWEPILHPPPPPEDRRTPNTTSKGKDSR